VLLRLLLLMVLQMLLLGQVLGQQWGKSLQNQPTQQQNAQTLSH
jgi:hypothetical protein